jgi:Domain of unknown function (DUF4307)
VAAFIREDDAAEDLEQSQPAHPGSESLLASRYGVTQGAKRRNRRLAWVGAVLIVVVFAAWIIWVGLDTSQVDARDTAHTVIDQHSVSVSFEVTMPPGDAAACAIQALNDSFAVVGWKIVSIPPSEQRTRAFTEVLRTSELSTTGLIYRCWPA